MWLCDYRGHGDVVTLLSGDVVILPCGYIVFWWCGNLGPGDLVVKLVVLFSQLLNLLDLIFHQPLYLIPVEGEGVHGVEADRAIILCYNVLQIHKFAMILYHNVLQSHKSYIILVHNVLQSHTCDMISLNNDLTPQWISMAIILE